MARKRLSDLLREEGQKSPDQNASEPTKATQSSSAKPEKSTDGAVDDASDAEAIPVTAEVIASQAEQVGDFVAELRDASAEPDAETDNLVEISAERTETADPAREELAATVANLEADLETAQQTAQVAQSKQVALQEQVASLEAKVAAQAEVIQQLQSEKQQLEQSQEQSHQQSEQLKTELEAAKKMILQLSQANAKPTAKPLPSTRAAEPELETSNTQLVMPTAKSTPSNPPTAGERPKLHQLELRKMLDHPTRPGSLPPMPSERKPVEKEDIKLSETDVGWMD